MAIEVTTESGEFILAGCNTEVGGFGVVVWNQATGLWHRVTLAAFEIDDHNVPCLVPMYGYTTGTQTKSVMAIFSRHAKESQLYYSISSDPEFRNWSPPKALATSGVVSYAQAYYVNGRIRLFYRVGDADSGAGRGMWCYRNFDPTPATQAWTAETIFMDKRYCLVKPNTTDSGFRIYAMEHPVTGTDHNIYACAMSFNTGNFTRFSDATIIGTVAGTNLPIVPDNATAGLKMDIVRTVPAGSSSRLLDIAYNTSRIELLYAEWTEATNGADSKLYHVRNPASGGTYNTGTWTRTEILDMGVPVDPSYGSIYLGGARFHPDYATNGRIVSCRAEGATPSTATRILETRVGSSSGTVWTLERELYRLSTRLFRPYWLPDDRVMVSSMVRRYSNWNDWQGDLLVIPA